MYKQGAKNILWQKKVDYIFCIFISIVKGFFCIYVDHGHNKARQNIFWYIIHIFDGCQKIIKVFSHNKLCGVLFIECVCSLST